MIRDAHVVVGTTEFDDDLVALTQQHGFRIDSIFPADAPATAIVSGHGVRLRLERARRASPIDLHLLTDGRTGSVVLPGGSTLEFRPFTTTYHLPENDPSLVVTLADGEWGVGRAGMQYRDLIPDRWGGRFIASHIAIPEGGPVPDYVHFHKIRFQLIFVRSGWVKLVYEDQGEPFVMHAGDAVLQPPEIRHRVLESSDGLEVIEVSCPADHETIVEHALSLPTPIVDPDRAFGGQHFVRHVAAGAAHDDWRVPGWEHRDTGIGDATGGLAGVRVARPTTAADGAWISHDTEFAILVVLRGAVGFQSDRSDAQRLPAVAAVAIPGGTRYRLTEPSDDCELLDVTLPAGFDTTTS